jgi:hypothetical protein
MRNGWNQSIDSSPTSNVRAMMSKYLFVTALWKTEIKIIYEIMDFIARCNLWNYPDLFLGKNLSAVWGFYDCV